MNDKTNFIGYSQTLGISGNASTTTTSNWDGITVTTTPGWPPPLNGNSGTILSNGSDYYSISTAITNSNNMNKQVKVAVFTVERNEDNKVVSSKFVKELWVEVKNGASSELSVAKQLDKDFDPSTTVVREIYSVTF
jgi:hypothetical protein